MTVALYQSTDASAPVLTGSAGSLVALLDAVLVNGYGEKAAAGWTIAYTDTNKRQYQMGEGGTGFQLFIDDAAPGSHGGREARATGFKTGTAIGTGTGQFPLLSQKAIGIGALVIRKSYTADATARAWTIIADANTFYLFTDAKDATSGAAGAVMCSAFAFGDFTSYIPNDVNNCMIIGRTIEANTAYSTGTNISGWVNYTGYVEVFNQLLSCSTTIFTDVLSGHFVAGGYAQTSTSTAFGKTSDVTKMGVVNNNCAQMGYLGSGPAGYSASMWTSCFAYPNAADQGLYTAPVWLSHNGALRGHLKGIWNPLQHLPLNHSDTYSGLGSMENKELIAISIMGTSTGYSGYSTPNQVHVEYSDTWS